MPHYMASKANGNVRESDRDGRNDLRPTTTSKT